MRTLAITLVNTAFWTALHFGVAVGLVRLPESLQRRWFDFRRPRFQVSTREMAFYRRIGLPRWKDRLPQWNWDFNKRRLSRRLSAAYLEEFCFVTCRAEVIHELIFLLGWLSLFFCLLCEDPAANLPLFGTIAFVICTANLPFSMIQRYNRRRLQSLLSRFTAKPEVSIKKLKES